MVFSSLSPVPLCPVIPNQKYLLSKNDWWGHGLVHGSHLSLLCMQLSTSCLVVKDRSVGNQMQGRRGPCWDDVRREQFLGSFQPEAI